MPEVNGQIKRIFGFFETRTPLGYANDLWKYSPTLNMWAFMKGSQATDDSGSYGVKGIEATTNLPPAKVGAWLHGQTRQGYACMARCNSCQPKFYQ
ncbi:MAG: hypothetical protein IPP46_09570 [Bacteroidetes bacterium]|nr:hypothetical protein [Bacteroidota bacterium]